MVRAATAVLGAAVTLAGIVAGTGPAQAASPAESGAASSVFGLLNSERAANRLPPLQPSVALGSSAHAHNLAMAAAQTMSHQVPGEPDLGTRISRAGVAWHSIAENIGWNSDHSTAGADALEVLMYDEQPPNDGHRRNILSTSVRYVGVDVYIDGGGHLWLTEDFADTTGAGPRPAPAPPASTFNPFGHLDSVTRAAGHHAVLTGWAADPDNRTRPLQIAVYADGRGIGRFTAPTARPDVARIMHTGPRQGFRISIALTAGRHRLCAYAINIGRGTTNPLLGCLTAIT